MKTIFVLGIALVLGMGSKPAHGQIFRQTSQPLRVTASADGLEVRLTVPRRSFPMDALVPTTIKVRNISHHPIHVGEDECLDSIQTEVIDNHKGVVYPPAFGGEGVPDCPALVSIPCRKMPQSCLWPGHVLVVQSIVLLREYRLRARVDTDAGRSIYTPAITLRMAPRDRASARFRLVHGWLVAHLYPERGGSLYSQATFTCHDRNGTSMGGSFTGVWTVTKGSTLPGVRIRGCIHGYRWQFVAGWIGHTVIQGRA